MRYASDAVDRGEKLTGAEVLPAKINNYIQRRFFNGLRLAGAWGVFL
jgi:hypothetical protein